MKYFDSRFYDVDGFLAGNTSLREIELAELTQVNGRRLLHLQCHFGLDTLSWARLGAACGDADPFDIVFTSYGTISGLDIEHDTYSLASRRKT
jgi:hypothetical protein